MSNQPIIETIGSITKMEMLSTVEENIRHGTLVLTNSKPFPGYTDHTEHSALPSRPQSYYLITMYRYFPEKLERIARALKNDNLIECCSSFGEIIIHEKIYPCIRIKRIKSDILLTEIQDFYKKNEIKFMPFKHILAEGKIKVFKHFKIFEFTQGMYRDLTEGDKFYFNIPVQLNWKLLDHFVKRVKSKISNSNFDTAIGTINRFTGPEDIIRIYDKDRTLERALDIRKHFIREFKKEKLLISSFIDSTLVE